ncbi:hypothetical protein IKQ74_02755 [Candidatus Saccharibacteria bacterium]|nr:hypothetical protein [Candidatus Saccharibacteria bacterium]
MKRFFCLFVLSVLLGLCGCSRTESVDRAFLEEPEVRKSALSWYDQKSNTFDLEGCFSEYGLGQLQYEGYGVFSAKAKAPAETHVNLMLSPQSGSIFIVDGIDGIRSIECVCSEPDTAYVKGYSDQVVPKALLVELNTVLDRITDSEYSNCLEESLEAISVNGCTISVTSYDEYDEWGNAPAP